MSDRTSVALLVAVFVGAMDQTVVAAVLPAFVRDLSIPFDRLDEAGWAVTLYLAAYAAVVPTGGRLIDSGARSAALLGGLLVFAIGSVMCGLAGSLGVLVAGRVVQALGAGVLLPVALASIGQGDPRRRLFRIGLVLAVAEGGAVCGPLYGAAALAWLDWRWVFWLNIPLAAFIGAVFMSGGPPRLTRLSGRLFLLPVATGLALGLIIAGVSREAARAGFWVAALCIVCAGVLAALLVKRSSLARGRGFGILLAAHGLLGVALMVPLVLVPVWANTLLALDASGAAQVLLRMTLAIPPGALIGAAAARIAGTRAVALVGFLVVAVGLQFMATWQSTTTVPDMTLALVLAGVGFGLLLAPLTELVFAYSDARTVGSAVSLATAARVVGMAVGLSLLTRWGLDQLVLRLAELPTPNFSATAALADYERAAAAVAAQILGTLFLVGAGCAALAGIGMLAVREQWNRRRSESFVLQDGGGLQ
ncbi:MAG: MFS transporter [Chloroflexi bacterium]|nr:MFS transporter [Chloroflexota bacterium]